MYSAKTSVPGSTSSSSSHHSQYEDRDDQLQHQISALSGDRDSQIYSQSDSSSSYGASQGAQDTEEMINLYTCDFAEFSNHMAAQYGREAFARGFEIISKNKELIYTEEGEEQLVAMLKSMFKGEDVIRGFLNFCTSYIIVQNYSQNIQA